MTTTEPCHEVFSKELHLGPIYHFLRYKCYFLTTRGSYIMGYLH